MNFFKKHQVISRVKKLVVANRKYMIEKLVMAFINKLTLLFIKSARVRHFSFVEISTFFITKNVIIDNSTFLLYSIFWPSF